jgi:hypothetical protein
MGLELLTPFIVAIKFTEEVPGRVFGEMMRTQGLKTSALLMMKKPFCHYNNSVDYIRDRFAQRFPVLTKRFS